MIDSNEMAALNASMRGAIASAAALTPLAARVEALDPRGDIATEDLEELARVTLAHAVAAQALRGLVETMKRRRGAA
jgi:hypothetical protein